MNLKKESVINSIILHIFFKRSPMPVINTTRSVIYRHIPKNPPLGRNHKKFERIFKNEFRSQTAIKDWNFWVMQFWTF